MRFTCTHVFQAIKTFFFHFYRTDEAGSPSPVRDIDESSSDSKSKIEASKEAATEAELRAARERAQIPLEQRIKTFRDMLVEKEVSAFSTWEKELHKIVFDSRYLLLTSKERKQVFEKYIKERAEEERKEKAAAIKRKKEEFRELLKEANITSKSSFNDFATRHCKDDRFKAIEKMRDRESLFNDFIDDMRKREKEDKNKEKEKLKKDYTSLLKEAKYLHRNSSWSESKKLLENDSRYKAVDSSSKREDWFRDYIKTLDAAQPGPNGDINKSTSSHDNSIKKNEEKTKNEEEAEEEKRKEKEKQERIEASIKEREKEVKEQLSKYHNEREKEREQLKHDEACEGFRALLTDLVKNLNSNWKESKKNLKRDSRWDLCKSLEKEEKVKLYEEHIQMLRSKKKDQFFALLDETTGVTLTSTWKEVKKLIKNDPRYEKLSHVADLKLDKAFSNYILEKYQKAKDDFKQLLEETKLITYKTYTTIKETPQHLKEIEDILSVSFFLMLFYYYRQNEVE